MKLITSLALWPYLLAHVLCEFSDGQGHYRVGCDGATNGEFALNPADPTCRSYLVCQRRAEKMNCPKPLIFNIFATICEWPNNALCPLASGGSHRTSQSITSPPHRTAAPKRTCATSPKGRCKRIVCYDTTWPHKRGPQHKLNPKYFNAFMCTHLVHAYANLIGNRVYTLAKDLDKAEQRSMYRDNMVLKRKNPCLKILLAVGGYNVGSRPFTAMVATPSSRNQFITTTIYFLRTRGFDGLSIDWAYPARRGSPPEDKARFTALLKETMAEFEAEARKSGLPRLVLSASVTSVELYIDTGYEVSLIARHLDFATAICFDRAGPWDKVAGLHNQLYNRTRWQDWAARDWVRRGFPKHKLVLGIALFGRTSTFATSDHSLGAPIRGGGKEGPVTKTSGFLAYHEFCRLLPSLEVKMDAAGKVPWVVSGDEFISFENAASLKDKMRYITTGGYGGAMVYSLESDDSSGEHCGQGHYPLIRGLLSASPCRSHIPGG